MAKPRILYIAEEITPYLSENKNSLLGRDLPTQSQSNGYEVRIFMPRFGSINERRNQLHEVIRLSGMNIPINDTDHPLIIKVASMQPSRIQVYFIDNDDYFQRLESDIDALGTNRSDNDERAIFYTRGAIETVKKLRWEPSVVNCMGWMSALSPLYMKRMYEAEPGLEKPIVIYTLLENENPQSIDPSIVNKLREDGFKDEELNFLIENPTSPASIHKLAMSHADAIVVFENENDELVAFAKTLNKPLLVLSDQYSSKNFLEFYAQLTGK